MSEQQSPTAVVVVETYARWVALQKAAGVVEETPHQLRDTVSGIIYVSPARAWQFN